MIDTKPKKLSPADQEDFDNRLIDAAKGGHTETVQTLLAHGANVHVRDDEALRVTGYRGHTETVRALLASGANVHAMGDYALRWAADAGRTATVKILLASGANAHAHDDEALRMAAKGGHTDTAQVLAAHIFAPESWRGQSRVEIEAQAEALFQKITADNPEPDRLRTAGTILLDCALCCWEQVRPPPPKLQISPLPAQPRPV
jgi:hypothetical protein